MSAYIDSVPPASSAAPSRSDLHSRQLCATAPRSRTTSVVTGSSARSAPTVGANWLSSRSTGSVSRSHTDGFDDGREAQRGQAGPHARHEVGDEDQRRHAEGLVAQRRHERRALLGADHRHVDGELLGELGAAADRRRRGALRPAAAASDTASRAHRPHQRVAAAPRPRATAPSTASACRTSWSSSMTAIIAPGSPTTCGSRESAATASPPGSPSRPTRAAASPR